MISNRLQEALEVSKTIINNTSNRVIKIEYTDFLKLEERICNKDGLVAYTDDDGEEVVFKYMNYNDRATAFVLQWIYPHSTICIVNENGQYQADNPRRSILIEILNRYGIYIFKDGISVEDAQVINTGDLKYYLNLKGMTVSDFISNHFRGIRWDAYDFIYIEDSKEEITKLQLQILDSGLTHMSIDISIDLRTIDQKIEDLKNFNLVNVTSLEYVKNFLARPVSTIATRNSDIEISNMLSLLKNLIDDNVADPRILHLENSGKYQEYPQESRMQLEFVLALYIIKTGGFVVTEQQSSISKLIFNNLMSLSFPSWDTLLSRLKVHQSIMSQLYHYDMTKTLPVCVTRYDGINWFAFIKDIRNKTEFHIIPWTTLKNTIVRDDAHYRIVTHDNQAVSKVYPLFKSRLIMQDQSPRLQVKSFNDAINQFDMLELNAVNDEFALFTGEHRVWKDSTLSQEKVVYAFWYEVCRFFEQFVMSNDDSKQGEYSKGYNRYVTIRDLVFLRHKETGQIYLAYAKPEYEYEMYLCNEDFAIKRTLNELKYASIWSYQDIVDIQDQSDEGIERKQRELVDKFKRVISIYGDSEIQKREDVVFLDYYSINQLSDSRKQDAKLIYNFLTTVYTPNFIGEIAAGTNELDLFERELADNWNVETFEKLDKLAKVINPYGGRMSQSIINIFGGMHTTNLLNLPYYEFVPRTNQRPTVVQLCSKHLMTPPE